MFIGHFGVGFGAKRAAPAVSLGTLFMAAQFVDLLWPTFLLLGIEHVEINNPPGKYGPFTFTDYPISHSLLMVCVWGLLFGVVYWMVRKNLKGAVVLGLAVLSHWLLDLIVHAPDLPLWPGNSPRVGFGLWASLRLEMIVEALIFIVGLWFYIGATRARNRSGSLGLWGLVGFLCIIFFANASGPPPSTVAQVAWVSQAQWLIVIWGYWVDRNRVGKIAEENFATASDVAAT